MDLVREKDTYKYDEFKTILPKEDLEILNLIKIDMEKTYQQHEIFTKETFKQKIISVLYLYIKENQQYEYKQGIKDILRVFLYILYKKYLYDDDFCRNTILCEYFFPFK